MEYVLPRSSGTATVETALTLSSEFPTPPQSEPIATVDIAAPEPRDGASATIQLRVERTAVAAVNADIEQLQVVHFADGEWVTRETTVVSRNPIVLEASTDQFSMFAVVEADTETSGIPETEEDSPEPSTETTVTTTATPISGDAAPDGEVPTTDAESTTSIGTPGFGIGVTLLAVVCGGYLLRRRNNDH